MSLEECGRYYTYTTENMFCVLDKKRISQGKLKQIFIEIHLRKYKVFILNYLQLAVEIQEDRIGSPKLLVGIVRGGKPTQHYREWRPNTILKITEFSENEIINNKMSSAQN